MPPTIVAVGEVLWDLFPNGRQLGGAAANFTVHAHGLGAEARLISRVGADALGEDVLRTLQSRGLNTETVAVDSVAPTGTVEVTLSGDGQPAYRIVDNVAWDHLEADAEALAVVKRADAVCFGTLAQRSEPSREAIRSLLEAVRPGCLRVFDVNRRLPYWSEAVVRESLALADAVKVNEEELNILGALFGLPPEPKDALPALADRFPLKLLALTRGSYGSLLYANGEWSEGAGVPVQVRDAVGAGDSFTAVLTIGFLAGWPLDRINERANALAAFVCSQPGATPQLPRDLW